MRFLVMVKATAASEAGVLPNRELLAAMGAFNNDLARAGVLLDANGLRPSAKGARLNQSAAGEITVTDGPFADANELVGGYWLIQTSSLIEAVGWIRRCPQLPGGGDLEIRQLSEPSDFV